MVWFNVPSVARVTIIVSIAIALIISATKNFFVMGVIIPPIPSINTMSCIESNFLNFVRINGMSIGNDNNFEALYGEVGTGKKTGFISSSGSLIPATSAKMATSDDLYPV